VFLRTEDSGLRLMWCFFSPPVQRSRNQEHGDAQSTQSKRAGKVGCGIGCASATMCDTRYSLAPAIGVLLCPTPSRVPRASLMPVGVRVRLRRYSLPPRLCAVQPRGFPQSDEQVRIVGRPWTMASPERGPSAPATVRGRIVCSRRVAVGDRRKHDCDRKVEGDRGQGQQRQAIGPSTL
jgi:hypothetical protein